MNTKENLLYLDIETTGLSPETSALTVIGCCEKDGTAVQWFNESGLEQKNILSSFLSYAEAFDGFVTYNGGTFDLPFLKKKCEEYGLSYSIEDKHCIDLYKHLRSWKHLLPLQNLKQKTVEEYLGIKRRDRLSGRQLIKIYQEYIKTRQPELKSMILQHNKDDVSSLPRIQSLLILGLLADGGFSVKDYQMEGHIFSVRLSLPLESPKALSIEKSGHLLTISRSEACLSCPLIKGQLKHYHKNIKDYRYLPLEDLVIPVSMSSFVDQSSVEKAVPENCYTRFCPDESFLSNQDDLYKYCTDIIFYLLRKDK
ncbi:ribonuclease H-like domain-containing protein [Anaerostipes sp.]|uniref:ribonuclease H-like domain-containing protein n=1 Tax=Anaerostipes sp. TaxID=1872530 RepID=UPI0025C254A1|nr:ribonuclease H-like domain-containing protein [Anaerostipes sp.]MBS7008160.1 ribonuclease H-like domain-containing protein [Anaerostipes sp.]